MFDSSRLINPGPRLNDQSFESLFLNLFHPTWKTVQPVQFIMYQALVHILDFYLNYQCFFFPHLHNIAKIWHILSQSGTEKIVDACVTSRLDYCKSLLCHCPN